MPAVSHQTDFAPPFRNKMVSSPLASIAKAGGPKPKSKAGSTGRSSALPSTLKSAGGSSSATTTKSSSKTGGGTTKAGGPAGTASRQAQSGATALEYNTPRQNQMLSQCDYADRTIWATRVLWGGNSVNGFLRATATAQRIKKQRARQNNSTKMSRAAKAASTTGMTRPPGEDEKKGATTTITPGNPSAAAKPGAPTGPKAKEIFNQQEEELLKKEIMNPRTAKKLKSELEAGLTFCATVCNVLRGVLFDMDPSLSPSLPPHLILEQEKPPPAHTFLIPSPPPPGSAAHQKLTTGARSTKGGAKSKLASNPSVKGTTTSSKTAGVSKQQKSSQPVQSPSSSPGDPNNSTLRRLRKSNKKNKGQSVYSEPAFANLPPEFDPPNSNKRTCTKKEYQHRVFQLLRYRDLKEGDFCAARLSSRDLWILAKVLKDYKTTSLTPLYTISPLEFLSLSDPRRDTLFHKEKVLLEDVEDQQGQGSGTHVIRSLVLPLPRSPAEANEWASRLIKKGSRVYAMYPQTTSLYAASVIDSITYCRGDDDIIVVQFDGEDADPVTGQFPSYHIPARFVTLIPREFPASQTGRAAGSTKSTSASTTGASSNKRKSSTGSSGSSSKKRQSAPDSDFLNISMDFGAGGLGGFDDLDLDFDKPLDDHEQEAVQGNFSPF